MDIEPDLSHTGHGAGSDAESELGRWAISVTAWSLTKWRRPSGNVELLEAITAYSQILHRKRKFRGEAASKFHAAFPRGNAIIIPSLAYALAYANYSHYRRVEIDILPHGLILLSENAQTSTVQCWCLLSIQYLRVNLWAALDITRNTISE